MHLLCLSSLVRLREGTGTRDGIMSGPFLVLHNGGHFGSHLRVPTWAVSPRRGTKTPVMLRNAHQATRTTVLPIDKGIWELQNSFPDSQLNSWPNQCDRGGWYWQETVSRSMGPLSTSSTSRASSRAKSDLASTYIHCLGTVRCRDRCPMGGSKGRWSQQNACFRGRTLR